MINRMIGKAAQVVPGSNADPDSEEARDAREARMKAAVHTAVDVATDVAGKAKDKAKDTAWASAEVAGKAKDKAMDTALASKQRAEEVMRQLREAVEAWTKRKLQSQVGKVLDRIPPIVKDALEDQDMPRWASKGKDHLVDSSWPDIRAEVLWEVAVLLDRAEEQPQDKAPGSDCCRAFFRYHLFPYDKSFWGTLRDPWFIIFTSISLIPVYGVYVFFFFFVFIIIDKSDEYQLVSFILSFKGYSFISQGLGRALTGFALFLGCVTAEAEERHRCESRGPGTNGDFWGLSAGLLAQIVLVWFAFLLLRCSERKGRSALKGDVEDVKAEGSSATKGGYLIYFLWYDLACFIVCGGIMCYIVSTRPRLSLKDWRVQHSLYGIQVLYGILSAPFFLFTLPVLQRLLTHVLPTGYDRHGRCRQFVTPRPKKEVSKRPPAELVSEEEINDLVTKIKSILPMLP